MQCDASYITSLADQMEDRGLLERVADPSDRRVKLLALTDKGHRLAESMTARMGQSNPYLDRLSNDELRTYAELLEKAVAEDEGDDRLR